MLRNIFDLPKSFAADFRVLILGLLLLMVQTLEAQADTWFVERDGTGDFSTLQPAVDAAASGDTIRIGPGRYNELAEVSCISSTLEVRIFITQHELTIIGSGPEQTIIGPEVYLSEPPPQIGITAYQPCGSEIVTIKGIRFENLNVGVHSEYGDKLCIDNCSFVDNYLGILTDWHEVIVTNSTCIGGESSGGFISTYLGGAVESYILKNCISEGPINALDFYHVGGSASDIQIVTGCEFKFGSIGVVFQYGNPKIENCTFSQTRTGIRFDGGTGHVKNCIFSDVDFGVRDYSYGNGTIEVKGSVFSNIGEACFQYRSFTDGFIKDCILEKGSQYVVSYRPYSTKSDPGLDLSDLPRLDPAKRPQIDLPAPPEIDPSLTEEHHFDMTNNYWGTSDPDSIQAWIEDGEDHPGSPYFVDWFPFNSSVVSDTPQPLGSLKSLYR